MIKIKINELAEFVDESIADFSTQFTQELFRRVVNYTPVDTGLLRGSNRLSVGTPNYEVGPTDKSGTLTKAMAKRITVESDDVVYISNGAHYAEYVENGTRHTRPQAFIKRAVAESPIIAKRIAGKL